MFSVSTEVRKFFRVLTTMLLVQISMLLSACHFFIVVSYDLWPRVRSQCRARCGRQ